MVEVEPFVVLQVVVGLRLVAPFEWELMGEEVL